MTQIQTTDVRAIALSLLIPSKTEAQTQRRKHFDKGALQQLADSFKSSGVLNPIVARPIGDNFEIVAGERRFQAAKIAGLDTVPVSVKELSDDQVLEVQLIENLQREGLHELHEAEGYEQLRKRGMTAVEIADKVGKSKEYVFARMKLLALCKEARAAFYDGDLNASTALHLARIPGDKMQQEALKEITKGEYGRGPMSSRDALEHIQKNYMLRLSDAPFDASNPKLIPGATACGACPKNTLAQPGLFGDVKSGSAGVCTDLPCFRAKTTAAIKLRIVKAKESGQEVVEGADAKKIFPHGNYHAYSGYTKIDETIYDGNKSVKIKSLIPKDAKPILVCIKDRDGQEELIEVVPDSLVKSAKRSEGVVSPATNAEKKAKRETAFRKALYLKVREKHPAKLGRAQFEVIAEQLLSRLYDNARKDILAYWLPDFDKGSAHGAVDKIAARIPKLTDAELSHLMLDCCFVDELRAHSYHVSQPKQLLAAAKAMRINVEAVRAATAPKKKAKASKSKGKKNAK